MAEKGTFVRNLEKLLPIDKLENIQLVSADGLVATIPNKDGKRGSLQVYANIMGFQDGDLTEERANQAIELFGEYVEDARKKPGAHPNIDRLFEVQKDGLDLYVKINYKPTSLPD